MRTPDVLVLAAGGVLGEAWMTGVLAGIEDAAGVDLRGARAFVGTSAGSIVAARLAAGQRPRRPGAGDGAPTTAAGERARAGGPGRERGVVAQVARLSWLASAPLAPAALALHAPAGARLRAALLARMPDGGNRLDGLRAEVARLGSRFDGRLRVCCVERDSGRRVVFGSTDAPPAEVADAVAASCAIPWVFRGVQIDGRTYVDGGAWSLTNLDAAPAGRGDEVLCLSVVAGLAAANPSAVGLVRGAAATATRLEALTLRRRGARVRTVAPDDHAARAIGSNLMDPRPSRSVLAAGFRQGRALAAAAR